MIPYIELLNKYSLKPYAVIEPSEIWAELSYYEVGEFEIYCIASKNNLAALQKGAFIRIPNKRFIWVINSIRYTYNSNGSRMILAKGKEAKDLLNKRIIQEPLELPLNLANAVYKLVNDNLGSNAIAARRIINFNVLNQTLNITIDPTQAARSNLQEFVNNLLKTYKCGSYVTFENGLLNYQIINGRDKTGSVIFAPSLDNLLSSEYFSSDDNLKTFAEVVSKFTEKDANDNSIDVYYTSYKDLGQTGVDRSEILINSDISTSYKDASGNDQTTTPTSPLYISWQEDEGKKTLAENTTEEAANGDIDLDNSIYKFDEDFFLGDKVRIIDEYFNYSFNARITKVTFRQNAEGYGEEFEYKEDQ